MLPQHLHEIHWEVTNRCNLRCKHCLPMSGLARKHELTTSEALAVLEKFQAAGVSRINFTGGEPFSRKDFPSILERAVTLGMRAAVITNASLLRRAAFEMLKRLGVELGISLDGADEITHDAIRGRGSFLKVIEALEVCRMKGIPTTLYVTVTGANASQLSALAKLVKQYACRGVHFNEISIAGRAISFSDELQLSSEQRGCLSEEVARVAMDIFGEQLSVVDERCWVDGVTLYMAADGELYVCSEVFQRRPELAVGNVRSFSFQSWLDEKASAYVQHGRGCCYGTSVSEHVVFVGNIGSDCAFASRKQHIETLMQFSAVLDDLYQGIEKDCKECQDPDCMGYVWLLKEEVQSLYERGIPLVQVNNGPTFIHSFPITAEGRPDLSVRYPTCSQLCTDSRRCSIHKDRPFVCHLYPLGFETKADGTIVWALHRDCLHVRRLGERGLLTHFKQQICSIINSLSPRLLREIVETYCAVDAISAFPDGENDYFVVQEIHDV
ncbi:MAG: radical SAM protein [bacterium]|nr:radical SAM protein [bacterium]